jgi:hypothetical protein
VVTPDGKLLALALYELKHLLGTISGKDAPHELQVAWRLTYALHNDAWSVVEDKSFDSEAALTRIAHIDQIIGGNDGERIASNIRRVLSENQLSS